ncbi:TCR/Tet family MFS transporter [Undibacterium sp. 5I1]|uniref:TCR/Tet family MFS transporter n=1 Tax=unclassified Undibacterium TaxID=2630295 RepID=UPI002AB4D865|nr:MULTISPECIES: TCR/Tet family MFS transporter [unclassified Undibacterium]MDY7539843.1 TCR/Tet family MFS transporter [Undibacterium sp. 5I1]MEB0232333.1 TCR/Tet family MFS transporter [Undibacterium sp. 10I3]MEB0256879.1 TCR/Tet family MFS transporter [Undibacterium sp. 5I1]
MSTEPTSSAQSTSPEPSQTPTSAAPSFLPTNIRFVLITVFLDILGIGLIIPVLPRLVASFTTQPDMQAYWYGLIVAIYGVMQFFCAPIIGALSDRFGRRPVLLICVLGLGLNFLLMTLATSIFWLLFVRALGGVTAGNLSVASAYIADSSAPSERSKALGKIGAMFGLGFICGPVLGGVLGEASIHYPFYLAATVSLANVVYGYFSLPESLSLANRKPFSLKSANPFSGLSGLAHLRGVGPLVWVYALTMFAQFTLQTTWVLSTELRFGWSPMQNGFSLFCVGISSVIMQGVFLGRYIKRVGDANAVMFGLTSSCLSLSLYGLVTQGWMMYVLILCNVLAFATGPALQAMFSRAVDARSQGTAMGSLTALASIMSVCATLAGTSLLGQVSHQAKGSILLGAPFFMAAVVQAIALVLATRYLSKSKVVSP